MTPVHSRYPKRDPEGPFEAPVSTPVNKLSENTDPSPNRRRQILKGLLGAFGLGAAATGLIYHEETGRIPFVRYHSVQEEPLDCISINTVPPEIQSVPEDPSDVARLLAGLVDLEDC